jgi:hypothetical protein
VKEHISLAKAQIKALKNLPVRVHILGPGFASREPDLLRKRLEIRDAIQKEFPCASVYFSEDQDLRESTAVFDNLLDEITIHAQQADVMIAIVGETTRGVLIELGRLSLIKKISDKLHIFSAKETFENDPMYFSLIRNLPNDFFTRRDVLECSLVTRSCRVVLSYLFRRELGLL